MKPPSVMKLSPGIYSKKESYKTESHKANLTVLVEAFNCSYTHVRNLKSMVFGSVFENRIDLEIIEICFIYQTPI